jgi:16S rRNA G966 N2-methylase RsmD
MNVFEKYPHFISTDPRTNRTGAYSVSAGFMQIRHECLFGPKSLEGKTVLDLGACVGATGAWALAHGAKFYCGVEYHKDLTDIAEKNLMSFDSSRWKVINQSVEELFATDLQTYDIVIASGLLYAFFEPIPILKNIANCANTIIIESAHPYNHNKPAVLTDQQMTTLRRSPEWLQFIETEPFISYRRQSMLWGAKGEELIFNSSVPSMGFVVQYMAMLGFDCDASVNESLKNKLPEVYNSNRFGIKLIKKTDTALSQGFLSATEFKPDVSIRNWSKS